MATISIDIPDAVVPRVLDAFAATYSWPGTGLTKGQFAKQCLANYVKEVTKAYEASKAAEDARKAAADAANADITAT